MRVWMNRTIQPFLDNTWKSAIFMVWSGIINIMTDCQRRRQIINRKNFPEVLQLKKLIESSLDDDKASDITTIDLQGKSSLADYMIVATGLSQKHLVALADHIIEKLEDTGRYNIRAEGSKTASDWIVVDAGTIIIHLFRAEKRGLYNLEKMWATSEFSGVAIH